VSLTKPGQDANMRVTVDLEWESHGAVRIVGGKLRFPDAPESPGIYRFTFRSTSAESVYIGETDRLRRRFTHHRNPGPSQRTNQQISAKMKSVIENGGKVELETATQIRVEIDGRGVVADLAHRPYRLLAENAALVIAREAGQTVENL
jgi:hypothetical protein